LLWSFGQTLAQHAVDRRWRHFCHRRRVAFQNCGDHAGRTRSAERELPGQHFIEHQAKRKDVTSRVGLLALQLLWRHVIQRSNNLAIPRNGSSNIRILQRSGLLCEAKIEEFNPLFGEQDVAGLEVAMDNSFGVGGIQGIENLHGILERLLQRQWTL